MWWMAMVGAAKGILGASGQNKLTDVNNRLSAGLARDNNKIRDSRNQQLAARNSLSRWVQSVNNNRALTAGAKAAADTTANFYRQADAFSYNTLSQGVAKAEQAGAAVAGAAAAGVEGGVTDMVNLSTRLRSAMVEQRQRDVLNYQARDTERRAGDIMSQTIQGLDTSLIVDSLDYTVDTANVGAKQGLLSSAIMGAASTFGGPGGWGNNQTFASAGNWIKGLFADKTSGAGILGGAKPYTSASFSTLSDAPTTYGNNANTFNWAPSESWRDWGLPTSR